MPKPRKRRNSFPEANRREAVAEWDYNQQIDADNPSPGMFGFFRDIGVRETIESLLVAILLALMFRVFECEAFIIPTGSMAPSLNGQHYDLECGNCQLRYHTGTSLPNADRDTVDDSTHCPICRFPTRLLRNRGANPDFTSNSGDRILVNKFAYDFSEPERFDVIVFKNPHNGKQNYIKRLIGLPGDNLAIQNGDIYLFDQNGDSWDKRIARKPSSVLRHILQIVDDTHHIGPLLEDVNWPLRWQEFNDGNDWVVTQSGEHPIYKTSGGNSNWLRYRHFQPHKSEWGTIVDAKQLPKRMQDKLPSGVLISDQYAYNDLQSRYHRGSVISETRNEGLHWVGDIGLECDLEIAQASGEFSLDIVEGGVHLICTIDIKTGTAKLSSKTETGSIVQFVDAQSNVVAEPTATTSIGPGSHRLTFVNADDQLHLWVNGSLIEFDAATYIRNDVPLPYFSATDPGDAEPLGIASNGASLTVERLKVVRDIYYTSAVSEGKITNESGWEDKSEIYSFLRSPEKWAQADAKNYFGAKKYAKTPMFQLKKGATLAQDQFLPMGDNSPNSLDGRFWFRRNYVQRDMLIGQATFIYWPHMVNQPFPYCPNFWEMGFIR